MLAGRGEARIAPGGQVVDWWLYDQEMTVLPGLDGVPGVACADHGLHGEGGQGAAGQGGGGGAGGRGGRGGGAGGQPGGEPRQAAVAVQGVPPQFPGGWKVQERNVLFSISLLALLTFQLPQPCPLTQMEPRAQNAYSQPRHNILPSSAMSDTKQHVR